MNALFLKDLALKTHRGIRGRVETGKRGGGNAYGYRVVKQLDARGEPVDFHRDMTRQAGIFPSRSDPYFHHVSRGTRGGHLLSRLHERTSVVIYLQRPVLALSYLDE
ncbi:hypothetical protein J2X65_004342 [Ancylobacter sp. 3268]|nr:hypothetical protein [Ancylobacter sp. 3268]